MSRPANVPRTGCIAPHIDEDFAHHVLGRCFVADNAHREPEHPHIVAGKKDAHRIAVVRGDQPDELVVGDLLGGRMLGRYGSRHGVIVLHGWRPPSLGARFSRVVRATLLASRRFAAIAREGKSGFVRGPIVSFGRRIVSWGSRDETIGQMRELRDGDDVTSTKP
jgi:hypothetical protein